MALRSVTQNGDFTTSSIDGISIVKVNILRATIKEADEFKHIIDFLVTANHHKIIVDFVDCHYIDSVFVGILINAVKGVRKTSGDIITVLPKGNLNNLFAYTGLYKVFKIFRNFDDAVASFSLN